MIIDIVVICLSVFAVGFTIFNTIRNKKKGKTSCGCSCSNCPCSSCPSRKKQQEQ